jgi:hypothetical protein
VPVQTCAGVPGEPARDRLHACRHASTVDGPSGGRLLERAGHTGRLLVAATTRGGRACRSRAVRTPR